MRKVEVDEGKTKDDASVIEVGQNEIFKNAGTVIADESITVNGGTFNNTGEITTGTLEIYSKPDDKADIAGSINASQGFIYRGINSNLYDRKLYAKLDTPVLHIIGTTNQTGLQIMNKDVLTNVDKIIVESQGEKTGLVITNNEQIDITAPIYLKYNSDANKDARVEVYSGATLTADKIIAESGRTKVQLNGKSSATLNNIEVKDSGNFTLQTLGDVDTESATFNLNNITVGDNAQFKTCIYEYEVTSGEGITHTEINGSAIKIKSNNLTINLGENAKADLAVLVTVQKKTGVAI